MKLLVKENKDEAEKEAVKVLIDSINKILEKKDKVVLGICGGKSVVRVFNLLKEADIQWNKVHIFMVDERLVPVDDKESNFKLAKDTFIDELISKGKLPNENAHPFILNNKEGFGISDYEIELNKYGGHYDIILLSSGEDGHVCALFPNHESIKNESPMFITLNNSPKPPPNRMTASRKLLSKASVALLLFFGESKEDVYKRFCDASVSIYECPAKIVKEVKEAYVFRYPGKV